METQIHLENPQPGPLPDHIMFNILRATSMILWDLTPYRHIDVQAMEAWVEEEIAAGLRRLGPLPDGWNSESVAVHIFNCA